MGTTLAINPGSSSKKYALYRDGALVEEFVFESANVGFEACTMRRGEQQTCEALTPEQFADAFSRVAAETKAYCEREKVAVDTIAIRVVAPGTAFQKHSVVDDAYLALLKEREAQAPLHIPSIIHEIKNARIAFPKVRIVAASDSAFHASLPPVAREFSIARSDAAECDIHRFGYHGLSVSSVINRLHPVIGQEFDRVIVCHIGSGVSVTAVKQGVSVDTTMGYSPVSGVPMGTRASDLDADALITLMRIKNMKISEATVYLNNHGGLFGLAGDSDIRHLLARRAARDEAAVVALSLFTYQLQKAIAASTVALGGVDALIFTGTAGFRSAELRTLIAGPLAYLGIVLDQDKNDVLVGKEGLVSAHTAPVKSVVIRTDEMREIARVAEQRTLS
jgi:acetate kinase